MVDAMKPVKNIMELKETTTHKGPYVYAHHAASGGVMAVILPYRKRLGTVQYLLRRELIPCWDNHIDVCGISVCAKQSELEPMLLKVLEVESGFIVRDTEVKSLGVCACDRHTDTTCYLYAVDLTRHAPLEERLAVDEEMTFWGTGDDILESVDSQLIACFAKVQYLLL